MPSQLIEHRRDIVLTAKRPGRVFAECLAEHFERFDGERKRFGIPLLTVIHARHVVHRGQRHLVFFSDYATLPLEHRTEQSLRVIEPSLFEGCSCDRHVRFNRVFCVLTEHVPSPLCYFAVRSLRLLETTLIIPNLADRIECRERLRMVRSEYAAVDRYGMFQQRIGQREQTERCVDGSKRSLETCLHRRLAAQILLDFRGAFVQNLACSECVATGLARVRYFEQPNQKIRHSRRGLRFVVGPVALARNSSGLNCHRRRESHQQYAEYCDGGNACAVAAHKFADAVLHAWRTGENGNVVEMTTQVRRQVRDRAVPAHAVLLDRLHRDPVEVTLQLSGQPCSILAGT